MYGRGYNHVDPSVTYQWFADDSKEVYEKNKQQKETSWLLEYNGWCENSVSYKFNSEGFRTAEFTDEPSIMFLGCCSTFGLGINYEDTYGYIASKKLGLKYYNFAYVKGSNDTAFRFAYYWVPVIRPKIVVLMTPQHKRLEIIKHQFEAHSLTGINVLPDYKAYFDDWMSHEANVEMNYLRNKYAISHICSEIKAKFVLLSYENDFKRSDQYCRARDLIHDGVYSNYLTAGHVIDRIESYCAH